MKMAADPQGPTFSPQFFLNVPGISEAVTKLEKFVTYCDPLFAQSQYIVVFNAQI